MIIFTHFATPYNDRERFRMHTMRATKVPKTYIYFWCLVLLVKPYPSRIQGSNPALNEFQSVGPLSIVLRNCCPLPGVGGGGWRPDTDSPEHLNPPEYMECWYTLQRSAKGCRVPDLTCTSPRSFSKE